MGEFGIGQPVRRFEDKRLLCGNGRFQNDNNLLGQAYAYLLRSPHAHARIRKLDLAAAQSAPGVMLILTGDDLVEAKLGVMGVPFQRKRPDGSPMFARAHLGLAQGTVRYVGEPVAFVVAETLAQAKDAAELIHIDYEAMPSVTDTAEAAEAGSRCATVPGQHLEPVRGRQQGRNRGGLRQRGAIVKRRYVISRVYAHFMEPRGAIGVGTQARTALCYMPMCSTRTGCVRRSPPVFSKSRKAGSGSSPAMSAAGSAPRAGNIPSTAWCCSRRRNCAGRLNGCANVVKPIQADEHARDNVSDAELALDKDANFLGLRVRTLANVGAYISSERNLLATFGNVGTLTGTYDIPAAHVAVLAVMANTNGTAPYRGAGRPEATYCDGAGRLDSFRGE